MTPPATQQTERPFGLTLLAALSVGFGIYNLAMAAQLALALRMKLDPSTTPGFDRRVYKQKLEKQYVETKVRKKP